MRGQLRTGPSVHRPARRLVALSAGALVAVVVAACSGAQQVQPSSPSSQPSAARSDPASTPRERPEVVGEAATGLAAPWSVAVLSDGSALITGRDSAEVSLRSQDGSLTPAGRIDGVVPGGEGGLLGIAVPPGKNPRTVYVYYTSEQDNRIDAVEWDGSSLGEQTTILDGIPKASIHNGGRIAFGPDGNLYAGTGDAGSGDNAQDPASLGGKILRLAPDGRPAEGNPDPGSVVYSSGHRNVQGLAWDADGRLWASEFGQNDADELNLIEAGGNYGWPQCEGPCDLPGSTDPAVVWSPTAISSPSGMAIADGSAWVASLRGQTLWQVPLDGAEAGEPRQWLTDDLGRLRDVVGAPGGGLWVLTNNTDGRGSPRPGDDRIVEVALPGTPPAQPSSSPG